MAESTLADVAAPEGATAVRIDELIVGRTAGFPIYDENGLLLVAEGLTITPEIKRTLRNRHGGVVMINAADVQRLTLANHDPRTEAGVAFDQEISAKLDEIVSGGFNPIANRDRPVRDLAVRRGMQKYDPQQRRRLQAQHQKNSDMLAGMIRQALRGETLDGDGVLAMMADYLSELIQDSESVLTSIPLAFESGGLSTNPLAVSTLSMALGMEMGLDGENVRDLGVCGLIHDWGMLRVPEEIRNASHRLSSGDRVEITKHPIYSLEILERITLLPRITPLVVYQVHERPNGQGYPRGRSGKNIHPFAKMVAVADTYTALRSERPFRPPLTPYAAMECVIRQARDRHVEPEVVRALLRIQSLFPLGSYVTLSDSSVACVLRSNGDEYTKPIVQCVQDAEGNAIQADDGSAVIDLLDSRLSIRQALPTPGTTEVGLSEDVLKGR
jgi:HD-GYP domain-containing protein (c-di-GMP phosphodiesterase class II)